MVHCVYYIIRRFVCDGISGNVYFFVARGHLDLIYDLSLSHSFC